MVLGLVIALVVVVMLLKTVYLACRHPCSSGCWFVNSKCVNVPRLCMLPESFNAIYGTTRNPHDEKRAAGGSSGAGDVTGSLVSIVVGFASGVATRRPFCRRCA